MCYKQKCKVVSLNLAHPVDFDEMIETGLPWSWISASDHFGGTNFAPFSVCFTY